MTPTILDGYSLDGNIVRRGEDPDVITGLRRAPAALAVALVLSLAGAGAAMAAPSPIMGSATPNPPGGTSVLGQHDARVCVSQFAPGTEIHVVNQTTGETATIHSNFKGKGCNALPISHSCRAAAQTIVETGKGADGKPTTVTQTVTVPAASSLCTASAGSTLPFTGSNIILPGTVAGLLLIIVGTALTLVRRRRRADALSG
jgi:hypothetical protein